MTARDIQLGLGNPPDRRWLFVGQDEGESSSCWYQVDHEKNAKVPVAERALTGYITGLRIKENKFRGESKFKLDIFMDAGAPYGVRAGLTTTFARGIILSLSAIEYEEDLRGPLTLVVSPSRDNSKIVFGSVYLPLRGMRVKYEWDKDASLAGIIENLQAVLGDAGQADEAEHGDEESSASSGPSSHPSGGRTVVDQIKAQALEVGFTVDGAAQPTLDTGRLNEFVGKRYGGKNLEQLSQKEHIEVLRTLREM